MRKVTKIVAALLVAIAAASFVACSKDSKDSKKSPAQEFISLEKQALKYAQAEKEPSESEFKSFGKKVVAAQEKFQKLSEKEQEEIEKFHESLSKEELRNIEEILGYAVMQAAE